MATISFLLSLESRTKLFGLYMEVEALALDSISVGLNTEDEEPAFSVSPCDN